MVVVEQINWLKVEPISTSDMSVMRFDSCRPTNTHPAHMSRSKKRCIRKRIQLLFLYRILNNQFTYADKRFPYPHYVWQPDVELIKFVRSVWYSVLNAHTSIDRPYHHHQFENRGPWMNSMNGGGNNAAEWGEENVWPQVITQTHTHTHTHSLPRFIFVSTSNPSVIFCRKIKFW